MRSYSTQTIHLPAGDRTLPCLLLRPVRQPRTAAAPGILWIHGGGYITGMAGMVHFSRARHLVSRYGAIVLAPAYRLAGQAPYPAALLDCHRALSYLCTHADELGIRSDQLMVGGESAGGGLTAALCQYERDIGGIRIAYQMPLYPMLDNEDTVSSRCNHAPVWNTRRNHYAWRRYLRGLTPGAVPPYAAPARQTDYRNLPPAYTFVGTREPFYAETLTYIRHLREAGVPAELDIYPGLFHAFDMLLPFLRASRTAARRFEQQFERARHRYFAPQPAKETSSYEQ